MENRVDLGGSNAMMHTKRGVINVYKSMIDKARDNIGKKTIFNVLITEEFIERLEDRVITLQSLDIRGT